MPWTITDTCTHRFPASIDVPSEYRYHDMITATVCDTCLLCCVALRCAGDKRMHTGMKNEKEELCATLAQVRKKKAEALHVPWPHTR